MAEAENKLGKIQSFSDILADNKKKRASLPPFTPKDGPPEIFVDTTTGRIVDVDGRSGNSGDKETYNGGYYKELFSRQLRHKR